MGWKDGEGLGRERSGITTAFEATGRTHNIQVGLGNESAINHKPGDDYHDAVRALVFAISLK